MRFITFLSFFLLALLSVISFAAAEPLPAASLAARDPPDDDVAATGGEGGPDDDEDKRSCDYGWTQCYYFPRYCCPRGYGAETAFVTLLLTSNDPIDGPAIGATRGSRFGVQGTKTRIL
jgi:hypothetical protein